MMIDGHDLDDADAETADDPAVLRAERRLKLLEEMAEIGMRMLRALESEWEVKASDATGSSGKRRDPVDHYASLTRSLRLTLKLEAETDQELVELKAGVTHIRRREGRLAAWSADARPDGRRRDQDRRDQVRRCLKEAAESEAESPEQLDDFFLAIDQRLAEDPAYADLEARPLREIVERLCLEVCLYPDWTRWTGSGWAGQRCVPSSVNHRPRYSKFTHSSPRPIWGDDPIHDLE